jgi:hypothetical protein
MTEIERHSGDTAATGLAEQLQYAQAVAQGSLLPETYRGKPANVLIAIGLGQAMGLSPAESLYRIDVIQGKPTASAELIAANVRKAGHKLRVRGTDEACTATIIRADDPDFEFTVTRDLAWAQRMGLMNKSNYKSQPGTMLQWRAISACARLACPEALYGVAYTPDEMDDMPRRVSAPAVSGLAAALATPADVNEPDPDEPMTDHTRAKMFAMLNERGITDRDAQIAGITQVIGRQIESRTELTEADGRAVIASLEDGAA